MTDSEKVLLKELVLKAIQYLEINSWDKRNNSRTGDLVYNSKLYPTKPILSNVVDQIKEKNLDVVLPKLSGGEAIFKFLENLGFEIKRKNGGISYLIENYKKHIRETQLKDEKYKWELLDQFKGRPNLHAIDFLEEIKSINYSNLIYPLGKGVLYHLLTDKPEEIRAVFKVLFDESKDLTFRVKFFNTETLKIYRSLGEKLQHHQDERTISTYLTFNNPDRYTFYKYSFYKKMCGLLKENEAGKNEKYEHYLLLLNRIIEDYIQEDSELIELVKNCIPDYYNGSNHLLLTQDILYQMLDKKENVKEVNVKSAFIDWMAANVSGGNYYEKQFGSKRLSFEKELNLYEKKYSDEFTTELFIIDTSDLNKEIEILNHNIYSKGSAFYEFSDNRSSHLPRAMLGKKNYLRFLTELFELEKDFDNDPNTRMKMNLNQILYGPPGTGKTYHTINKSLSIIEQKSEEDLKNELRQDIKNRFDDRIKHGNIVFTTFHQSMSYEDFIEGIKPKTKGTDVIYEIEDGVFKKIADKARLNWLQSKSATNNFEALFELLKKEWQESENSELRIFTKASYFDITDIREKNIDFRKASGGTGHDLVISTLKDLYLGNRTMDSGLAIYYFPLIEKLKTFKTDVSPVKVENYVLIIDEINRGNVSQIFGELITLIEEDKRLGNEEALEVTLPYSKERFGVPPNLFIIGTMNTADRSVEALDTALRRRFCFEEMQPNSKVVEDKKFKDFPRKEIMEKINNRIELLLDRNHTLGHAYFIKRSFESSFENEIIPLLQEYFYNDFGKIGLILGTGFVKEKSITKSNDKSIFADFETKNEVDIIKSYELIPLNEVDFGAAITTLLA